MNAVREQFMALQKYLWMLKTPISNTVYEFYEKVQYIHINTYSNKNCQITNGHNTIRNTEVCTGLLWLF